MIWIELHRKCGPSYWTVVDDADAEAAAAFHWHARVTPRSIYATTNIRVDERRTQLSLHTWLTGWTFIDHIDCDGLNNRRANLREASRAQNGQNQRPRTGQSSQYKGVARYQDRWQAYITVSGRKRRLGFFSDEREAARAYDAAAVQHFGPYARPNFVKVHR